MPSLVLAHGDDHTGFKTEDEHTSPSPRVEASRRPEPSHSPKVSSTAFCSRFGDATGSVGADTLKRFGQLQDNFGHRKDAINADFGALNNKITLNRHTADEKLQNQFKQLEAKATTDAQKAAVSEFESTIRAATTRRRTAVDAADTAFRQGLLAAVAGRQAQLQTAAAAYKTAVANALAAAKVSCAAGTSADTVRTNLQTALKTARTNLDTARKAAEKVGPNVETLKAARRTAVDQANTEFKAAVKAALAKLRAALAP